MLIFPRFGGHLGLALLLFVSCQSVVEPVRLLSEDEQVGAEQVGAAHVSLTTLHRLVNRARPGGVAWISDHSFGLEGDPSYTVERDDETKQLWPSLPDGTRQPLALEYDGKPEHLALARADWQLLRGFNFAKWDDSTKERIQWIDPPRRLVEFGIFADPPDRLRTRRSACCRPSNRSWGCRR